MIQRTEARLLASSREWGLISSSLPPDLSDLSVARLKAKISRAGRLRQKYSDQYRRQKLASKARMTGRPHEAVNVRTERKKQMFEEAIARLKTQLGKASSSAPSPTRRPARKAAQTGRSAARRRQSLRDRTASPARSGALKRSMSGHTRRRSHAAAVTRRRQAKRDSTKRRSVSMRGGRG
ncbi:MAG TPA: hypothetical protein VFY29_02535 [Terriglobia bacterium]|nr:hypothetical protein [Terriglobia bacterium]